MSVINKENVLRVVNNKKFQLGLTVVLFLIILYFSTSVRLSNVSSLVDQTTGKYIPADPDSLYFLRVAEKILDNGSNLPAVDTFRYPGLNISYAPELLSYSVVYMYKIASVFDKSITIQYIDIISPAIFYFIGFFFFFFLCYVLTNSKSTALLSSAFLAFIPSYLFRTMTGISDHDPLGMIWLFAALMIYTIFIKYIDNCNEKKNCLRNTILLGLGTALSTALTIAGWGGVAVYIYMIIPFSFLLLWLLNLKEKSQKIYGLVFYLIWIIFSVLFGMLLGFNAWSIISRFTLSSYTLITLFALGFIIIDLIIELAGHKIGFIKKKYQAVYSLLLTFILGVFGLVLTGRGVFSLVIDLWDKLLHPFGLGRVGLTVAENAQPYLTDWISQTGTIVFWLFMFGIILMFVDVSKGIKELKHKIYFVLAGILLIAGIIFSRISESSILNGSNLLSQLFYLVSLGVFGVYAIWLYFNEEIKIRPELILIISWAFFVLITGRSAIRLFFALTPFMVFVASYALFSLFNYAKDNKDEVFKVILWILFLIALAGSLWTLNIYYNSTVSQASSIGLSVTNVQWQDAMAWVRENTSENSLFLHWWDYGYLVHYMGQRPTVTDGGHANSYWDHLVGRYVLTTPFPETALSYMKSFNVSYLLIDPSDLGKYAAYSKIGGDDNNDRFSSLPTGPVDISQIRETSNGTMKAYQTSGFVDEDIVYEDIFIPGPTYDSNDLPSYKSYVVGVILEEANVSGIASFKQPNGIYYYNGKQYRVPLRYVYYNGNIYDFKSGLNATFMIIPYIYSGSNGGTQIDVRGAGIYLSPRVNEGLFARLYLMDDVFNDYPTIKLAHSEDDFVVKSLKDQGVDIGEFIYYNGFRGPLKIWKVDYPSNIITRSEFLSPETKGWAEYDNLTFTK